MNRKVKMLSRRLYSPSLKNVGGIEDAQLIFLICYIFLPSVNLEPGMLMHYSVTVLFFIVSTEECICLFHAKNNIYICT